MWSPFTENISARLNLTDRSQIPMPPLPKEHSDTTRGVDRQDQSQRLRGFAALGLSLRSVSHILSALGCRLSRMSVWRDVQEAGTNALRGWMGRSYGRVRIMGADETVVKVKGNGTGTSGVRSACEEERLQPSGGYRRMGQIQGNDMASCARASSR